jgi:hypothetical protein
LSESIVVFLMNGYWITIYGIQRLKSKSIFDLNFH